MINIDKLSKVYSMAFFFSLVNRICMRNTKRNN